VVGANLELTDAKGQQITLHTADNGNFYTTQAVTFPHTVRASKCPDSAEMPGSAPVGSCNTCHDATMRIHLPRALANTSMAASTHAMASATHTMVSGTSGANEMPKFKSMPHRCFRA